MKKIIALILLISIPFGLVLSESYREPLLDRIEKQGYSLQPKDSLWEYVKNEVTQGRINLKVNYAGKYRDPILLTVENATVKDSLAIERLMKELEQSFSLKEVAYYSDFVGRNYEPINEDNANDSFEGYSYDELVSFNTKLTFDAEEKFTGSNNTSSNLGSWLGGIDYSRKNRWNRYFSSVELIFHLDDEISIEEREMFIKHHLYESIWKTHSARIEEKRQDFRIDQTYHSVYRESRLDRLADSSYLKDDEFVLRKIFSDDFNEQFENYMYKIYPRRYANLFVDKEEAKQNATAIVALLGFLILILGFTLFWNRKFKYSFLNYFFPVLVVFIGYMSLDFLFRYMYIEYGNVSMNELIASLLGVFTTVLVIAYIQWQFDKSVIGKNRNFTYQIVLKTMMTLFAFSLPWIISGFYNASIMETEFEVALIFMLLPLGAAIGRGLLLYLNHFSDSLIKQKDVELSQLKEANAQAEVKLLQSQINPHFLYNALNSIATLARKDGEKTEQMALSLSDLFKYTINRKGKKNSTIKDEVEMVQNYLEIEQIRFGDRLQFGIDVPEELESVKIPMFIIQPLIENAVKHGISKNEENGEIALKIENATNGINILVEDNGPDFPDGLVSGHGLQTVYDLLRLSYGDDASIQWQNEPQKRITINIVKNI